ncbi:hypothetical protein Nepgr_009004 [Nepenthes gracilis]|uniref:Uncharacterized protein n=1 Tax=Nepenthes gracilis TaxID=150966 RepID=A0AAD3SAM4_NEPGR|nr:hypothetical protein Nepgr_009004 [Nepenthes gracilis]
MLPNIKRRQKTAVQGWEPVKKQKAVISMDAQKNLQSWKCGLAKEDLTVELHRTGSDLRLNFSFRKM